MIAATIMILVGSLWGGQSISGSASGTIAQIANGAPLRVEVSIHDRTGAGNIFSSAALGIDLQLVGVNQVHMTHLRSTGQICDLTLPSGTVGLVVEFAPGGNGAGAWRCEVFDSSGARQQHFIRKVPSMSAASGSTVTIGSNAARVAFARVYTSLAGVEHANTAPAPAAQGTPSYHWRFDGDLTDSVGGANLSGAVSYHTTPDPGPSALALVSPTRLLQATSVRAGIPQSIMAMPGSRRDDGIQTCAWSTTWTSPRLVISSPSSCTTDVTAPIAGAYSVSLTVSDATGSSTQQTTINAVATDSNDRVIYSSPLAESLIGPSLRFGSPLSEYVAVDERSDTLVKRQPAFQQTGDFGTSGPVWAVKALGTVAYTYGARGFIGPAATTLTAGISATDLAIPIAQAERLDLATLPTLIVMAPSSGTREVIRVCSTSATSGAATLTVCPSGRGIGLPIYGGWSSAPVAWSNGAQVGQPQVFRGTGTQFISDPQRPLCPIANGPNGISLYAAGQVSVTNGSADITLSGGDWTPYLAIPERGRLVIRVVNGSGDVFVAPLNALAATTATFDRPMTLATGTYDYRLIDTTGWWAVGFMQVDSGGVVMAGRENSAGHEGGWCQSETVALAMPVSELAGRGLPNTSQSGRSFSTYRTIGYAGDFGPNFYGTDLAALSIWARSQKPEAKALARQICDHWVRLPELAGGNLLLRLGGGMRGAIACKALFPDSALDWRDIRPFGLAMTAITTCDLEDQRERGFRIKILADLLQADPDSASRSVWSSMLTNHYTQAAACSRSGTWKTGLYWSQGGGLAPSTQLTVTNGSSVGTGTGIASTACIGVASGSGDAVNGSAVITGTAIPTGQYIRISNSAGQYIRVSYTGSGSSISISALWPYASGPITWMKLSDGNMSVLGTSNTDADLDYNIDCIWNSSTSVTLAEPWPGSTGAKWLYRGNLAGRGWQGFMAGILVDAFARAGRAMAAYSSDPGFAALASDHAAVMRTAMYKADAKAVAYGGAFAASGPDNLVAAGSFDWTVPEARYGLSDVGIGIARDMTGESGQGFVVAYRASASSTDLNWGDQQFAALFCSGWDSTFVASSCDSLGGLANAQASTMVTGMGSYKWPGFFFGEGASHMWPATRLGTSSAVPATAVVACPPSSSWCTAGGVEHIAPSGRVTSCPAPCSLTFDARMPFGLIR